MTHLKVTCKRQEGEKKKVPTLAAGVGLARGGLRDATRAGQMDEQPNAQKKQTPRLELAVHPK